MDVLDGVSFRQAADHLAVHAGSPVDQRLPVPDQPMTVSLSGLATLRRQVPATCFWIQLRGVTEIHATEGRFALRHGSWITFDPESLVELQAMHHGLTVGLVIPRQYPLPEGGLLPGAGQARIPDIRVALDLWRHQAAAPDLPDARQRALRPLLLHLQHLQASLHDLVDRCPGRTLARKRQVMARMQRVRMFMEGNTDRSVRLAELAELSRFSEWWVSKTYRAIYGETVQETSIRLRMERARNLLESTSLSISELGEACGFHDPCSFARLFKRRHGQTASKWRLRSQSRRQTLSSQSARFPPALTQVRT